MALASSRAPMSKPRVMQLVLSLSPGGTERLVIELCRRLADDVDTVVCCLDQPGEWADQVTALGIPVISLARQPGFHPSLSVRLRELLKARRIDVIHCHHYSPFVYGLLAAVLHPSVRVVFTEHGRLHGVALSKKRRLVNPVLARWPSKICAVSAALKRDMVAEGFPERSIEVVYNGVELGPRPQPRERTATRAALQLPSDAFVVGTVGRLDPVKNIGALVQALALVLPRYPTAKVVVVGDGPERQQLIDHAAAAGVSDAVTFAGYRTDVRALMAAFDVYVNCSTYEGVSLTILEAMATALPVVATDVGGNSEVVINQETGLLVRSSPEAIAAAVGALAENRDRRHTMGDASRWRVKRHFTIERMVNDYAAAYRVTRTIAAATAPAQAPAVCDANEARPIGRAPIAN
jgi:glycosyltransferase involved in cell wall biosynthesis